MSHKLDEHPKTRSKEVVLQMVVFSPEEKTDVYIQFVFLFWVVIFKSNQYWGGWDGGKKFLFEELRFVHFEYLYFLSVLYLTKTD